ncbi:MAG: hypothetical protein ACR5KV_07790 [Wolbachia sp.]
MNIPIKSQGDAVLRIKDMAKIYPRFEDREGFARINGLSSIVLEISKRNGKKHNRHSKSSKIFNGSSKRSIT